MFKEPIKKSLNLLLNPKREFEALNKRSFESVIADYMYLLIAAALLAGVFNFIFSLLQALYLDISVNISIQYFRMINYSIGKSTSLIFLYLFAGTFLLFFASLILKIFLRKIKYTSLLKISFYSLAPMLLFGWVLVNPLPLSVWSMFLLFTGIKTHKYAQIDKDSIERRE